METTRKPDPDRRTFLTKCGIAAVGAACAPAAAAGIDAPEQDKGGSDSRPASASASSIDAATLASGASLAALEFTEKERQQMLPNVLNNIQNYKTIRGQILQNGDGPAEAFDPRLPGFAMPASPKNAAADAAPGPLPTADDDIAFSSVAELASWLRAGSLTSERLTQIYLKRLALYKDKLENVITMTDALALEQARRADENFKKKIIKSPLQGIPYGIKDLFDTKGILTTWGAEPWRERVPNADAAVVRKLADAGAILVAKLSLGALAYGDIWFGGKTKNPWNLKQGSSGSSAGSAASSAAGLVGFAIGTETWGSIASPCSRCGTTGFRPTFGRVSRAGAMALCWSLDKVGPIARTVGDCALVLQQIAGADPADPCTVDAPPITIPDINISGARIGFVENEVDRASDEDKHLIEVLKKLGAKLEPVALPAGPYDRIINLLICVEGAAAFDEMTRGDLDDQLKWQDPEAWPNTFRTTRLVPAVEYLQASRIRRKFMKIADDLFRGFDAVVAPSAHGALHALTNMTGQPAVTLRQGMGRNGRPVSTTLWAPLFNDSRLLQIGRALEAELNLWRARPNL
ncbi:MAG: amidase [Planctomycetes bacterium]|nr:amidase [Planctomycetota bacterium]